LKQLIAPIQLRLFLSQYLHGKTVAIVGSAPSLLENEWGTEIDNHDVVIRLNLMKPEGKENFMGNRTDIRFIGCTLLEKHEADLKKLENETIVITTLKNYPYKHLLSERCFFYEKKLPRKAFRFIASKLNDKSLKHRNIKPPRTGFVCLSMLLKLSSAAKISLYGMSRSLDDSMSRIIYSTGQVNRYDESLMRQNHCEASLEVDVLDLLAKNRLVDVC
jgi:hypothetical protein